MRMRLGASTGTASVCLAMTAKEQLHELVAGLSESEAAEALDYLVARRARPDALDALLEAAPIDDEPVTPEEEAAVQEARDELARGETVSRNEILAEMS